MLKISKHVLFVISHKGEPCPQKAQWDPCGLDGCDKYHSRLLHGCTINGLQQFHVHHEDADEKTLLLFQGINTSRGKLTVFWDNGSELSLMTKRYAKRIVCVV